MVATYFLPSGNLYKPHIPKRTDERLPVATCFLLLTDKYIHTHIMHTHTHTYSSNSHFFDTKWQPLHISLEALSVEVVATLKKGCYLTSKWQPL